MGVISFLLRALFVLIFVRLLGLVVRAFFKGFSAGVAEPAAETPRASPRGAAGAPPLVEEMRRDPVCGVHVAASAAIWGSWNGECAAFCSSRCAEIGAAGAPRA